MGEMKLGLFRGDHAARAAVNALAVLVLTSIHHAYGAVIYHTPWRLHVVPIAVAAALAVVGALASMRARGAAGGVAMWVFVLAVAVVPVLTIGTFEGWYNHVLKNLLYFGGAPGGVMHRLFPPPRYEMPDDLFFEITGVLQALPATLAAMHLYRMPRGRRTEASLQLGG